MFAFLILILVFFTNCGSNDNDDYQNDFFIIDSDTGINWQKDKSEEALSWDDAVSYCNYLELEGITNWVLPNKEHYFYLFGGCQDDVMYGDAGFCDSCLQIENNGTKKLSEKCNKMFPYDDNMFWTSNQDLATGNRAWFVSLKSGMISHSNMSSELYARCIRE